MHTDDVAQVLVGTLATLLAVPGVGLEESSCARRRPVAGPTWTAGEASRSSASAALTSPTVQGMRERHRTGRRRRTWGQRLAIAGGCLVDGRPAGQRQPG